ncbi:14515_t:CDS:1, partial [Funneliformis mosseae]
DITMEVRSKCIVQVKLAVYRKIRMEKAKYADWEKESILQLENVLKGVNMSP